MTRLTALDLTPFYHRAVGVDRLFDRIKNQLETAATNNYPPYNILRTSENTYEIVLAVAGFREHEIQVTLHENELKIQGEKEAVEAEPEYLHRGISERRFVRVFPLVDYVEIVGATLQDGLLVIKLERRLPEAMQPRRIAINNQ